MNLKNNQKEKIFKFLHNIFFGLIITLCIILTICFKLNILTLISCIAGIVYVVFLSDRNIWNFLIGFISSTTYIFISYKAKLYGEVIFYLIIDLPMIFVSYFAWRKHVDKSFKVAAKKLSIKKILIISIVSVVCTGLYALILKSLGGVNVVVDSISTVVSLIATILMTLRYREQWFMWMIVYSVSIIMWATTFDLLMLIMSISCFVSSIIGFVNWTKSANKNQPLDSTSQKIGIENTPHTMLK